MPWLTCQWPWQQISSHWWSRPLRPCPSSFLWCNASPENMCFTLYLPKYIDTNLQHLFDLLAVVILTPACVNRVRSASTFKIQILENAFFLRQMHKFGTYNLVLLILHPTCVCFLFKGIVIRSWEANDLRSYRSKEHTQVLYISFVLSSEDVRLLFYTQEKETHTLLQYSWKKNSFWVLQ